MEVVVLVCGLVAALWAPATAQQVNRPPQFSTGGDMDRFALREDTAVGTSVYTLKGRDPEGTDVSFTISGDHLSVDTNTGVVILVKALDREVLSLLEVVITVTDSAVFGQEAMTVPKRRSIPILDVNDNPPIFHNMPYTFMVVESVEPGATLFSKIRITDSDEGQNARIKLECIIPETPEACAKFDVREARTSEGEYLGVISLKERLDYEKETSYTLALVAHDSGSEGIMSASATVEIMVKDVQDQPPVFINAPYSATVREASPPGTSVLRVIARDGDLGEPRPLTLTLQGDDTGYFTLEDVQQSPTGEYSATLATSKVPLDREDPLVLNNGGLYTFNIRVEETGGEAVTRQVTIVVTDVDDQQPTFSQDEITVIVPEDITDGTPLPGLNLVVSDDDVGENARFSLALEDIFGSRGVFSIFPESAVGRTPIIIKVADSSRLDYENPDASSFLFRVVASQGGAAVSSAVVNVTVSDSNDNSPVFIYPSYNFQVSEGALRRTLIDTLVANDSDSGAFGEIRYGLKGFGAEKFAVEEQSGRIFVGDCGPVKCLDYERQKSYSLTYSATDGGGKVSSVNIFIDVLDENDNSPKFSKKEYRRTVDEAADTFVPPLYIKAVDADGPSQGGGKLAYSLEEGNPQDPAFAVDPQSGELIILRPLTYLDTPTSTYALTIRATDAGTPPRHSDVTIYVTVGRDTNRSPRFRQRSYKAKLPEDSKEGAVIIQVTATDPDGPDEELRYFLSSGARDNFVMDSETGEVAVASGATLDRDSYKEFQVVVAAVDNGSTSRQTATATLVVTITDVNNKKPRFIQNSYVTYVSERLPVGEKVLTVMAEDPDENAAVKYTIEHPIVARDKTGVALGEQSTYDYMHTFSIDETTGSVSVSGSLDHNAAAVIILTITAVDHNASPDFLYQNDTVEATIYVQAFSDKNPIFAPPWTPSRPELEVSVKEEQDIGSDIFKITARDPVNGQPVSRYEKVSGSDPEGTFSISQLNGQVTLNKRLDYETSTTKTSSLQVLAVAGDRSSQATITVNIIDVNDNSPQFTENEYQARLSEDARWPKSVLTVQATDADTGEHGMVIYTLGGEGALLFVINETTGQIRVARGAQLDRETSPTITLEVTAHDTPSGGVSQRKTTVIVEIELTDVNDEPPHWSEAQYTAVVAENTKVGTSVTRVRAKDPDLGVNGLVHYELLEGAGELDGLFSFDADSGVLSVKAPLSGKGRNNHYELKVRALDKGQQPLYSEATVRLFIGDVSTNDGVPVFIQPAPNQGAQVLENSAIGTVVFQVKAEDADDPTTNNGRLVYSFLDDGNDDGVFEIDPQSGIITTRKKLDREVKSMYTVVVVATDLGRPPQLTSRLLQINVTDADDDKPTFVKRGREALEFEVEEEAAIGTPVGYVVANDDDAGENSAIDYRITFGNDLGLFSINRTSDNRGFIYVTDRVDREEVDSVTLTIMCGKLGSRLPTRKTYNATDPAMVEVTIRVIDLDDNKPQFRKSEVSAGVRIDAALQTEVITVEAIDKDPTAKSIRYGLHNISFSYIEGTVEILPEGELNVTGVFLLEENKGILRTNAPLTPYAHGTFTAYISAMSPPDTRPAVAKVTIHVLRDSELLRFVFGRTPGEVRRQLDTFTKEVEEVMPITVTLSIYETAYYTDGDGAIDFSSTGSCFQLLGRTMSDSQQLLNSDENPKLENVFSRYSVKQVEHCVPRKAQVETDWVEIWLLIIAAFIAFGGMIASCVTCCLHSRYKRRLRRHQSHMRLLDSPAPTGPVMPPGSIIMLPPGPPGPPMHHHGPPGPHHNGPGPHGPPMLAPPPASILGSEPPRGYEWQERGMPLDNISYRSGAR